MLHYIKQSELNMWFNKIYKPMYIKPIDISLRQILMIEIIYIKPDILLLCSF